MLQTCEKKEQHKKIVSSWETTICARKLKQHSIAIKKKEIEMLVVTVSQARKA